MSDPSQTHKEPQKPRMLERLRALFGINGSSLRNEIEDALQDTSAPDVSPQERAMLKNVLNLHELNVSDIMVPRGDIVGVSMDDNLHHVLSVFKSAGHSRLPVYVDTLDDPRGMIHIRDFLNFISSGQGKESLVSSEQIQITTCDFKSSLSDTHIVRSVLFVPPSMPALDLLIKMQAARIHMALVIDEYGGTDGLASIEDIVELIVGDIEDEHDRSEGPLVSRVEDGLYLIDARAQLEELTRVANLAFGELPGSESVDTIGGLVTIAAGRVLAKGESVTLNQRFQFEVVDADPRRIKKMKLRIEDMKRSSEVDIVID
jgi:CBS domain containing-hemolysin-like protein